MLLWLRFLYFLRIQEDTGYLVHMIFECFKDISAFMIFFIVVILAYADAFFTFSNGRKIKEQEFLTDYFDSLLYSYLMSLGEFGFDRFEDLDRPF